MTNPLLSATDLPRFSAIQAEHVEPAIDTLLADNRRALEALLENEHPGWETLAEPVALLNNRLARAWSPVSHLNAVMNNEPLREAYNKYLGKISEYYTDLGQNEALFHAYQRIAENSASLSAAQRKVLENALRDFGLSGIDLPVAQKARFKEISQELSALSSSFSDKVLDATNAWFKQFDAASALAGLPASALELAQQQAQLRDLQGYVITLDHPSYLPVMTYADDRSLREEIYTAFSARASDVGPHAGQFDNSDNMRRILALRHEQAQLLGYANFAELSVATKMAPSTEAVLKFLEQLAERSTAQARRELQELRDYARSAHGHRDLQPWDVPYYSEKLRQHRYSISEEELRPYFPADRVIQGMFQVMARLFDVSFKPFSDVDLYHDDVMFFEICDGEGAPRAQFYFDLYARDNKRGGAWMDDCQSRIRTAEFKQLPVAYMVCNFTPPVDGKPPLLTHREVETLFHEFGHGLHHMLTTVDHYEISGINGVAWDAVELPSQFMENYCWEREALDLFARHHVSGDSIPEDLYERMIAARSFQAGMFMARQLEFSLFDFRMHLEYDPARADLIEATLADVREQVAVMPATENNRFAHAFTHVFGGGYAAGYYSYKWAEVLSADAFSLFEENGVFDNSTGRSFLSNILEKGGSDDAMNLFVSFRGREPEVDALLRHNGIAA